MNQAFLEERIEFTKQLIVATEAAILALTEGGVQSYTLDTSQSRQTVSKFDLPKLNADLDVLYNRLAGLCNRLNGDQVIHVRPAF